MLSDEQIEILVDQYVTGIYQDLEKEIIADIARRVQKTGRYTETAELMAKDMVEMGYSADQIRVDVMKLLRADQAYQMAVAQNTKEYKAYVQQLIKEAATEAKTQTDKMVIEASNMAFNNDLSLWGEHGIDLKKPNTMSQLQAAFTRQTVGELRNLTKTTGFKNMPLGSVGVLNAYQREMDLALIKVASGTFSYDQAVKDCVSRLAKSGLRSVDYASGRSYQLDTAARMSVRTGLSQLAGRVTEANLEQTGIDLVITSQHLGSRESHVPWQNKVFSYSGKNKKYPDFRSSTGYGTVEGLKGANCTHDFYPFWEGSSIIPEDIKEPDPVVIDGKKYTYYQATQKQRQMERDIRATKREIEAREAIGEDATELKRKLRSQTQDYYGFSNAAGIKARDNRLSVSRGTSNLNKIANGRNSGIIGTTGFRTKKDAIAYLENQYQLQATDLNKLNLDVLNELNRSMGALFEKYPQTKSCIKEIRVTKLDGASAQISFGMGDKEIFSILEINSDLSSLENIEKKIGRYCDKGFWSQKTGLQGIIEHELGHVIEVQKTFSEAGFDISNIDLNSLDNIFKSVVQGEYSERIIKEAFAECGIELNATNLRKYISGYSERAYVTTGTYREAFAEAISDESDSVISQYVKRRIK